MPTEYQHQWTCYGVNMDLVTTGLWEWRGKFTYCVKFVHKDVFYRKNGRKYSFFIAKYIRLIRYSAMRELARVVSLFLILTGLAGCGSSTANNDKKIINDAINKSLGKPVSEEGNKVVPEDYPLVKTLSIYPTSGRPEDKKVVNIALIGKLTELTELKLGANNISDLSPLAGLNKLTLLDFSLNKVADLKPLEGKNALIILNAHGNQIKDISPLSGMTRLEVVYLSNNQISDITPLLQLKSLKDLTLKGNKVTAADIENLKKALPKGCKFQHD